MASRIIFADIEASGLEDGSYPIEVAWCTADLADADSMLIRPPPQWAEAPWSAEAEGLHGIDRARLLRDGVAVDEVAARLNRALAGDRVVTDCPETDGRWLHALFAAARISPAFAVPPRRPANLMDWMGLVVWRRQAMLADLGALCDEAAAGAPDGWRKTAATLAARADLVPHRALDDCLAHALRFAAIRGEGEALLARVVAVRQRLGR
jgi:hypothetical protein